MKFWENLTLAPIRALYQSLDGLWQVLITCAMVVYFLIIGPFVPGPFDEVSIAAVYFYAAAPDRYLEALRKKDPKPFRIDYQKASSLIKWIVTLGVIFYVIWPFDLLLGPIDDLLIFGLYLYVALPDKYINTRTP